MDENVKLYPSANINKIYLMMGAACNFRCRYCLQNKNYKKTSIFKEPCEALYSYLIDLAESRTQPLKILFWGGEPLLYFEVIKRVVARLEEYKPNWGMVSNGLLLTEEIVDYLNEHNLSFTLSNDGFNTVSNRNINMLENEDFLKLFKKIKHKSIEAVVTRYSYQFTDMLEYYKGKLGKDIHVTMDRLNITWDMPKDLYDIDKEDYKKELEKLSEIAYNDILNGEMTNAVDYFMPPLNRIASYSEKKENFSCGTFSSVLNVDMDGFIHICHNSSELFGHIKDARFEIGKTFEEFKTERRAICTDCEYFNLCKGGCPLETEFKSISCEYRKIYYEVTKSLADRLINSFEPLDLNLDEV